MLYIYAYQARSKWLRMQNDSLPPQFLDELVLKLMDYRSVMRANAIVPKDHYHVAAHVG
jgi:hypothetical protein